MSRSTTPTISHWGVSAALLACLNTPAWAAPVTIGNNGATTDGFGLSGIVPAQSFTATKNGVITSVAVANDGFGSGDCSLKIYSGNGTGGTTLHTQTITGPLPDTVTDQNNYTLFTMTLDAQVDIVSGNSYTFELSPANCQDVHYENPGSYTGGQAYLDGLGGNEDLIFEVVQGDPPNAAPTLTGAPGSASVTEDVATAVDLSGVSTADTDGDTLTITLAVTAGTIASTDGNGATAGVTVANSGTASMTLTGTAANINTYLDTTTRITYTTAANATAAATLTLTPDDGTVSGTASNVTLNVTPVNDAPVLDAGASPTLTSIVEDAGDDDGSGADGDDDASNNANNPGTTVSDLIAAGSITDADASASEGIAVTGVDNSNGIWQYSIDSGASWSNFSGTTGTSVNLSTSSRLLNSGTAQKVRFVPDLNYNGTPTLTFRAWDQTSGTNGGTADTTTNGGSTAFSSATDSASLTITALNDFPVIANLSGDSLSYLQGSSAQLLDVGQNATLTDVDSTDFSSGNLTVSVTANGDAAEDILSIDTSGVVALAGTTAGSNVSVSGVVVGTLGNNIAAGNTFVVNFSVNATVARVQTLLRALTYTNSDTTAPTANTRSIGISVNDGDGGTSATSTVSVTVAQVDADGNLTAGSGVTEPVTLDTTVDTVGEAVSVFDFTLSDGGASDGQALAVTALNINTSGTSTDTQRAQVTWRLNGPDASNVAGSYNAGAGRIEFSGLSISVADGASETYTLNAYFNDNTNVPEGVTFILSIDGDSDLTVSNTGTGMGTTTPVTNGTGSAVSVTATALAFTTQPASSTSGSALGTQPVVSAVDGFGNVDKDFGETVTLTEASAGTLSGNTATASNGVATFSGLTYTATADQQSFTLTANDQDGVGSDLPTVDASPVTSDVVATQLVFTTQPAPLTVDNGQATAFTTVPVVAARDANNITDISYSTDITLAEINGAGSATLTGTGDTDANAATVTLTPSSGVATFSGLAITYTNNGAGTETFNLQASSGGLSTASSSQLSAGVDADGNLTAGSGVNEPVTLDTTVDTVGEAVSVFDFTLSDGGTSDGQALAVTALNINVSGTSNDGQRAQVTWRLSGPDAGNVAGSYNASAGRIEFSGLSISVADGASETYTLSAYFNDNTNMSEGATFILSIDGDADLTTGGSGMGTTTPVTNGTGSAVSVTATALAFTTQPTGSTSGSALSTQPVVSAVDGFGNVDKDFDETVTLTEASAGSLTGNTAVATNGVATFGGLTYTATADQQSFTLTANDVDGTGSDLPTVDASPINSDVVATQLVFTTQPAPLTVESGQATSFTTVPVVTAQDANNVTDTGYATDITLAEINGAGNASLTGTGDTDANAATVTLTPTSGAATFSGLAITYTNSGPGDEAFNLQSTSGSLTGAVSQQITSGIDSDGDGIPDSGDPFPNAVTEVQGGGITLTTTPSSAESSCSADSELFVAADTVVAPDPATVTDALTFGVSFVLSGCTSGESIEISIDLNQPLPPGAAVYKVQENWVRIEDAQVVGSVLTYTLTDNGPLDQDPTMGRISDPVSVAVPAALAAPQNIPTLPLWALLATILGVVGATYRRSTVSH